MKYYNIAIIALCSMLFAACGESSFKVDGEVKGAEGKSMLLEKPDFNGRWITVDSVKIGKSGQFSIKSPAPLSPEIYRLRLDDNFIYFPIDSVENLTLTANAADFGHKYKLTGSPQAELLSEFEQELMSINAEDTLALDNFKRDVYTKYLRNSQGSILSYYVLTKTIDGKPLYDPASPDDAKYFGAVATQFESYRPDDPHLQMLKNVALSAIKNLNSSKGLKTVISANEVSMLDIELPDASGKNVKLSDVTGKGKPVVLVFSMMNEPESPAFNRELSRIYNAHNGSFEIYQISFDSDRYAWRDAAANLPWINVIDEGGLSSNSMLDYNVTSLPAVFLYNSAGELVDRPESLNDLNKKL